MESTRITRAPAAGSPAFRRLRRRWRDAGGVQGAFQTGQAAGLGLVGRQHHRQVGELLQQAGQHRQPEGLVRGPGAAQHQEAAAQGLQAGGGAPLLGLLPAQDHLLDPRVAGHRDGGGDAQVVGEAAGVVLGADPEMGEAVEEVPVQAPGQGLEAGALRLQRAGQQHHRHPLAVGRQHLVGPQVELDDDQGTGPPGGHQAAHGAGVVEGQVVVEVGAGAAVGVLPARRREVGDHHRALRILLLQGGDQGARLLVLADRRDVEPHAAPHGGGGVEQPPQQAAAPGHALGQLGKEGGQQGRQAGQDRADVAVQAQGGAEIGGRMQVTTVHVRTSPEGRCSSGAAAANTRSGVRRTRQARSPRWQGRLPLREQGRQSRSVSSRRLEGRWGA